MPNESGMSASSEQERAQDGTEGLPVGGGGESLTRLVYGGSDTLEFPEDVYRIVTIFAKRGFLVSPNDAQLAYATYSDDYWAAGWMAMSPDDDDIFAACRRYLAPSPERSV